MDRSYPYSRRLTLRARLVKRAAALMLACLVGAGALFMWTWEADPIATALPAQLAMNAAAAPEQQGVRRIYPYSVVPGGVSGHVELKRVIRTDRVVAAHYASFDADKARALVVTEPRAVHVSYRKGDKVFWTAHKVMLEPGETLLSDGRKEMRARCANRISDVPQYPVEAHRPAMEELDRPVDLAEGEGLALGPDGLPVSASVLDGGGHHPGLPFPTQGMPAGVSGDVLADSPLFGSTASGAIDMGPITTTALSGSSSSTGIRPQPSGSTTGSTPDALDPIADAGSGPDDASSASPVAPDGGAPPVSQPAGGTDTPVASPLPGTTAPRADQPAPDPRALPPMPEPSPLTEPRSTTGLPPGGGGLDDLPPEPPAGGGPLRSRPLPVTDPFIPPVKLDPTPQQTDAEKPAPAEIPVPGSLWLFGLALAAMGVLRRRR